MEEKKGVSQQKSTAQLGRRSSVGTGTTSLLMIFTVLCFATLAMLSLSTAETNRRMQENSLESSRALAQAKGSVAEMIAELDFGLTQLRASNGGDPEYISAAVTQAEKLGWRTGEDNVISVVVQIDGSSELITELAISPPGEAARYSLRRQASRLTGGWKPEEGEPIWPGPA